MPTTRPSPAADDRRRWTPHRLAALCVAGALAVAAAGAVRASADNGPAGDHGRGPAYRQLNLISDIPGVARITDPHLVNPWGLASGPTTPLWISDNGADVSTLATGGVHGSIPALPPLVVSIPGGAPSGVVFNPTPGFTVTNGPASAPARFIFDSEAGRITAWSPQVPPTTTAQDEGGTPGAVYKGLAIATTAQGARLYATDFHHAHIDVFDDHFVPVPMPGAFTDPNLPAGFAPFGIQEIGGALVVSYAKQDAAAHDDVAGLGLGFVDVYDTGGHLLRRLITQGALNSPWGLALAPRSFGRFGGDLLVGNFGDGFIHAYNWATGALDGTLTNSDNNPIQINGLWGLRFGNGTFGTPRSLIFSAGIGDESHGLLGEIIAGQGNG